MYIIGIPSGSKIYIPKFKSIKTNIILKNTFLEACEFLPQNSVVYEIQMYTTVARCQEKI